MPASELEEIIGNAKSVISQWDGALEQISRISGPNGEKFDLSANAPGISPPVSVERLDQTLAAAMKLVVALEPIDNILVVPSQNIVDLGSRVAEVKTHVERLKSDLDGFLGSGSTTAIDGGAFTAQSAGGRALNIGQHLAPIHGPLQRVLSNAQLIRLMAERGVPRDFSADIERIRRMDADLRDALDDLARLDQRMEELRVRLETHGERARRRVSSMTEAA